MQNRFQLKPAAFAGIGGGQVEERGESKVSRIPGVQGLYAH